MTGKPLAALILVAFLILAAGCTDEGPQPEPRSPALPGQALVAVGNVTGTGNTGGALSTGTIDTITFRVALAPGAAPVDMETVAIVYADAVRMESLRPVPGLRGTPEAGAWAITGTSSDEVRQDNRLDATREFTITLNPRAPIVPRQLVTIAVKTPSGPPLTLRLVAPGSILPGENPMSTA